MADTISLGGSRTGGRTEASAVLEQLGKAAGGGDRGAFGEIYELTVDEIYAFARSSCQQDVEAEDIVANVYLKAWKGAASFKPRKGAYRAWLFTIARNEVRDFWRARKRDHVPLEVEIAVEGPTADVESSEAAAVRAALQRLTKKQREIVVLRYFSGMSHAEIAKATGQREPAVRALLFRAMRKLRRVLGDAPTQ